MATDVLSSGSSSSRSESFTFLVDYDTVAQTIGLTCTGTGHARLDLLSNANQPSTQVAATSSGVDVATFAGSGVLDLKSTSGFSVVGGQATAQTSAGTATIQYATITATSLLGCLLISGSGTITRNGTVTAPQQYIDSLWADQFGSTAGPIAPAGSTDSAPVPVPNAGMSASPVTYDGSRLIVLGTGAAGVNVSGDALPTAAVSAAVVGQFNVPKGQIPTLNIGLSWRPNSFNSLSH